MALWDLIPCGVVSGHVSEITVASIYRMKHVAVEHEVVKVKPCVWVLLPATAERTLIEMNLLHAIAGMQQTMTTAVRTTLQY